MTLVYRVGRKLSPQKDMTQLPKNITPKHHVFYVAGHTVVMVGSTYFRTGPDLFSDQEVVMRSITSKRV